jgi:hypothetical protein
MGEFKNQLMTAGGDGEPMVVDTLGGRMHVHWDEEAQATPNGQLVFFSEFLRATACLTTGWGRAR